jgi:Holliday junction resolvase RusA-like endonuclease
VIEFFVAGTPAPGGSKRAFVVAGKARLTDMGGERTKNWRSSVAQAAAGLGREELLDGPLAVELHFRIPRPAGHYGKRGLLPSARPHPTIKPDALKLARSTEDALTGVLWRDDVQTVRLTVTKTYGEPAGCLVRVTPVEATPNVRDATIAQSPPAIQRRPVPHRAPGDP